MLASGPVTRSRFQDAVIALSIAILTAAGVAAIWGDDIAGWFGDSTARALDSKVQD